MTNVVVGILRKDGKVLLCQRKKGSRYGLKWEFPGGKVEKGESTLECLQRELWEELSIRIQSIDRMEVQTADYEDGGRFEVTYCFVSGYEGDPKNNVFEKITWAEPATLRTFDILDGNKDFIERFAHE